MKGFLLDTNVLSELRKRDRCDVGVRKWFEGVKSDELFVSVIVLGEIRKGIERIRIRDREQARALEKWLKSLVTTFRDRILPVDNRVADRWVTSESSVHVPCWMLCSRPQPLSTI